MACVFNELKAFHAVGSKANDIFQGLFEEGLSMDVMSTIRAMIAANLFSIEEINKKYVRITMVLQRRETGQDS